MAIEPRHGKSPEAEVAKGFQPAKRADIDALEAKVSGLQSAIEKASVDIVALVDAAADRKGKIAEIVDKHINQWARGRVDATVVRAMLLEIAENL